MGCDIHCNVEIKVGGKWHNYAVLDIDRSYMLFSHMAGVRNNNNITPISEPKGLPDDISVVTKLHYNEFDNEDAHTESWLSSKEVTLLSERLNNILNLNSVFGYFFGNSYPSFNIYKEDYPEEVQDFRFVFWFDN